MAENGRARFRGRTIEQARIATLEAQIAGLVKECDRLRAHISELLSYAPEDGPTPDQLDP